MGGGLLPGWGHRVPPFEGGSHCLHYLHHSLASGQRIGQVKPCPSTENWIKDLLSMTLPIRIRPSFPHSQSLPSGSFHKPLIILHQRVVQFSSVTQSRLTLCNPLNCSTPGLPVHHQLPEFTQLTSIKSVMPSSHLILCRPLLLLPPIPPSIRVFSNESALRMRWPEYWSFSFSIIPSKEIPELISPLGWTGWISLQSKGLSRVFSNTTVQKHQFFGTQLSSQSNSHIHTLPLEKP